MGSITSLQKVINENLLDTNLKHILEFGVFSGTSIGILRSGLDASFKVYGFDSFEGLPEDWVGTSEKKGTFTTNGVIPNIDGVKFFKGWFENTIPDYVKEGDKIGLLHVDCDLYSSTNTVLYSLNDFIVKNTVIVFDEWIYNFNPNCKEHEQKSFYEWLAKCGREFEFIYCNGPNESDSGSHEQKIVRITK